MFRINAKRRIAKSSAILFIELDESFQQDYKNGTTPRKALP
jgi:hypothetical protein